MGTVWKFGFGSILSEFFFERVLGLSYRFDISPHRVRDLAQLHWVNVLQKQGGGRLANLYPAGFFLLWQRQIITIDEYPYARIGFRGDTDMPLPPGAAYGDIGKESQTHFLKF